MKMKKLSLFIAGMMITLSDFAETAVVKPVGEAMKTQADTSSPETVFWIMGAALVVVFIFIVVLALAKGTAALSENLGDNYKQQNQPL